MRKWSDKEVLRKSLTRSGLLGPRKVFRTLGRESPGPRPWVDWHPRAAGDAGRGLIWPLILLAFIGLKALWRWGMERT